MKKTGIGLISCNKCGAKFTSDCTCPDVDARLREMSDSPHVCFKWCRLCDRHYARCECDEPQYYLRSGGRAVNIPREGLPTLGGARVMPKDMQS